jgi:predicted nucleic acid-binding protein
VLIVDTGPLVATSDRADKDHETCQQLLESDEGPLVTTAMVITEAAYLIDRQLDAKAEASLYASISDGQLEVGMARSGSPHSTGTISP